MQIFLFLVHTKMALKMGWCSLLTVWYLRPLGIKVQSCPVLR